VTANGRTAAVDPASAGLALDAAATVDGLTGFGLEPARLWRHHVGGGDEEPVTTVDDAALTDALEGVAGTLGTEPVDATVVFADGAAHTTEAVEGALVDTDAAADVLRAGWLTAARPLELPTERVEPDITQAEADTALSTVAEPFAAAPVVVAVGGQAVELPVDVLTSMAAFSAVDSDLALGLDGARLVEEVLSRTTNLLTPATDARFDFGPDGAPVIVPGTPGTTLDPVALSAAVIAAGTGEDRTARVELVASDPAQSAEALAALGVVEVVSEFSTPVTNERVRTENLRVGASKINGTLVRPGETFSLTEALGPITREAGFRDATVIVNGEHVPGTGGGLSQISTTTFNAAYLAGFEDVEHQPHSEWFARYPEGRESTLYTGAIDMKFKNTTPYGALVQAWVADGRVHVQIWGTKYWTVESTTSPRSGIVRPTTVHSSSPTCTPQSAGNPGFSVTVTRRLLLNGEEKETTSDTWRYKPQNAVVCDPPAAASP
jgi:vancomycin resistance protein YoaR